MKLNRQITDTIISITILTTAFTTLLSAQVTIGSKIAPVSGALLDLKESGDMISANKGLILPRVELSNGNLLLPMFDEVDNDTYIKDGERFNLSEENLLHSGLLVYNTTECKLYGKGLYVWTGIEWSSLTAKTPIGIKTEDQLILASGQDKRGAQPTSLRIDWAGGEALDWGITTGVNKYPNIDSSNDNNPNPITSSPAIMQFNSTFTEEEINTNPWLVKESILKLRTSCGSEKDVLLKQLNYALKVDGSLKGNRVVIRGTQSTFQVEGNVKWIANLTNDTHQVINVSETDLGVAKGQELSNGTAAKTPFTYKIDPNKKYYSAEITFQDAQTPCRSNDVTMSVINCATTTQEPSLKEWAVRAGFTEQEVYSLNDYLGKGQTLLDSKGNPKTNPNGLQLHKDQDGNLFLSQNFDPTNLDGDNERWMIFNLSAKTFVPSANRTGSDKTILRALPSSPSYPGSGLPGWLYSSSGAGTSNASYTKNPRLGLLYNWAAATNSRGGSNGTASFSDGATENTPRIQGICPSGWHIPNDYEFTVLEEILSQNAPVFSYDAVADFTPIPQVNVHGYRGKIQGRVMREACEPSGAGAEGSAKIISDDPNHRPGFIGLLTGYATSASYITDFGNSVNFWTSSGNGGSSWCRYLDNRQPNAHKYNASRTNQVSVRCKKDAV